MVLVGNETGVATHYRTESASDRVVTAPFKSQENEFGSVGWRVCEDRLHPIRGVNESSGKKRVEITSDDFRALFGKLRKKND